MTATEITSHRLVLPADANHHGTLYAGSLLRYALESAYAAASRAAGPDANLVLRRVLSLECRRAVPVGTLVELRAAVLQARRGYLVTGVVGLDAHGPGPAVDGPPWMDGLFGFAQVDAAGLPAELPRAVEPVSGSTLWQPLVDRLEKLAAIRAATAGWVVATPSRPGPG